MSLILRDTYPQDIPNRIMAAATRRETMDRLRPYAEDYPEIRGRIDAILNINHERIDSALISLLEELKHAERINEGVQATLHAEWIAGLDHLTVGAEEPLT
jgi:hypothetical protein